MAILEILFYAVWLIGFLIVCVVVINVVHQLYYDKSKVPSLHTKVVLITGCDRGFGKLLALRLDTLGMVVVATCLTESGAEGLKKESSSRLKTLIVDVADETTIERAHTDVLALLEADPNLEFWAVVNNAGIGLPAGFIEWISMDDYRRIADVNLWGSVAVTKAFIKLIKKSAGRVVFISSCAGLVSSKGMSSYAISKYGIEAFGDGLRDEMAPFNVGVVLIEPGWFATEITNTDNFARIYRKRFASLPQDLKDEWGGEAGMERKVKKRIAMMKSVCSTKLHLVVDAMEHAVVSVKPYTRYHAGYDSIFLCWWLALIPTYLRDKILRRL